MRQSESKPKKKAKVLYDFAEKCDYLEVFVKNPEHRSQTVVVVNVKDKSAADIIKQVQTEANMVIGSGLWRLQSDSVKDCQFCCGEFGTGRDVG